MESYDEYFRTKSEALRFATGVSAVDTAVLRKLEQLVWHHHASGRGLVDFEALVEPVFRLMLAQVERDATLVQKTVDYVGLCLEEIERYSKRVSLAMEKL